MRVRRCAGTCISRQVFVSSILLVLFITAVGFIGRLGVVVVHPIKAVIPDGRAVDLRVLVQANIG